MYRRIPWELVADPIKCADFGNPGLYCFITAIGSGVARFFNTRGEQ